MPTQQVWKVIDLGVMAYADVHQLQKSLAAELQSLGRDEEAPDTLLMVEHPPVITTGRHGGAENLLASSEFLKEHQVELVHTERGGNITCHFPGQLVVYPIVRLLPRKTDGETAPGQATAAAAPRRPSGIKELFNDLETIVIRTLARFGLKCGQIPGRSGVWIENRKICALGMAVKRRVTFHGLALNVGSDLSLFDLITPCGLADAAVTSLHRELGSEDVSMAAVKAAFLEEFQAHYHLGDADIGFSQAKEPLPNTEHLTPAAPAPELAAACAPTPAAPAPEKSLREAEPGYLRLPPWLRVSLPKTGCFGQTDGLINDLNLHTVCRSARCPNIFECYSRQTATFLILGGVCSRSCAFCNIGAGELEPLDLGEPRRVAQAAAKLNLAHVVITSVTRDDLPDGGSGHFADTIRAVRAALPGTVIEVLIPDFKGSAEALATVLKARPDILNHNVETVPGLYPRIRPQADFAQSLELLRRAKEAGFITKSGLMVGLGEDDESVRGVLDALAGVGCRIATVGQYMRPSRRHPPVQRYVHPDVFETYADYGKKCGIPYVFAAPLVRSSYNAKDVFDALLREENITGAGKPKGAEPL